MRTIQSANGAAKQGTDLARLKASKAWGLIVKAGSRDEAGGVLRRMGATPQQVEHALGSVEHRGEKTRWARRGNAIASNRTAQAQAELRSLSARALGIALRRRSTFCGHQRIFRPTYVH